MSSEEDLRQSLFEQADRVEDCRERLQVRQEIESKISAGEYTEDYWLDLMQKMVEEGRLIEVIGEDGETLLLPPEDVQE